MSARIGFALAVALAAACSGTEPAQRAAPVARDLLLVTIDTLRADRVGAYGHAAARTPTLDGLAREGIRFEHAFATAPITLTSHASLLTGFYPPGHGARHNGLRMAGTVPTLATRLRDAGFSTAAFVAAFPLDSRFGLDRGFDVYSDRLPRDGRGRPSNERPGREVADEAITWLGERHQERTFLWVHFFEPHAPYGDPSMQDGRPTLERYDEEVAVADREAGRVLSALGDRARHTLVVITGDHGESFGEHGEFGHSLFVYDTTLRVPLVFRGPGVPAGRVAQDAVTLVDVVPTVLPLLGLTASDSDGVDLRSVMGGRPLGGRDLYFESFAPLLDFGWSPLRAVRSGSMKAIAAPRPELYNLEQDPGELTDLSPTHGGPPRHAEQPPAAPGRSGPGILWTLLARVERFGPANLPADATLPHTDPYATARLASLGYLQGPAPAQASRADPKDRRELAARIAQVTSGEARGPRLLSLLRDIVSEDPGNGQMQLRLAHALLGAGQAPQAQPHFEASVRARVPSADPYIGLAMCHAAAGRLTTALMTLRQGDGVEPGNPVVHANIGLLEAQAGRSDAAVTALRQAVGLDPGFHEARFNLAIVLARAGRRADAEQEALELLRRLPSDAPQLPEVQRLLRALR